MYSVNLQSNVVSKYMGHIFVPEWDINCQWTTGLYNRFILGYIVTLFLNHCFLYHIDLSCVRLFFHFIQYLLKASPLSPILFTFLSFLPPHFFFFLPPLPLWISTLKSPNLLCGGKTLCTQRTQTHKATYTHCLCYWDQEKKGKIEMEGLEKGTLVKKMRTNWQNACGSKI